MRLKKAVISIPLIILLVYLVVNPGDLAYARRIRTPRPTPSPTPTPTQVVGNACSTSTPSTGGYTVTLCFTSPASGSTLNGAPGVSLSVSTTGTAPTVQRVIFYLNGVDLLTDFQSPYTFNLPTTKWQDGVYTLQATALMRDGYTTTQEPAISVTFNNGINQPPVNHNTFTPSTGTTPQPGAPFIVAAAGDGADGATAATGVANLVTSLNPNLFLYLGDVYEDGTVSEFYNWYGNQGSNFSAFASITDPTIGNHEYTGSSAAGYFDYWNNIPNYYSFNAGGWHFISLNSNSSRIGVDPSSAQYQWLSQDLAANPGACTIVYYHHPLYNIGPEGPTTSMAAIWALMAQYGVSIVLNGHDHDYQRWVPLDANGNPSPTGITEFVAGGAGHGVQTIINSDSRVAFSDDLNPETFGVLKLAINSSGAGFSYINSSGVVLDSGVVPCVNAEADTQAPSTPGGLTATAASSTQINLSWNASTDNVGVAGYTIYRDGNPVTTVSHATLSYSDFTGLPNTTYNYTIDAFDQAGNSSTQSSPVSVTTPVMPPSLTFNVQADTYVNASNPGSNYGSATVWRVNSSPDIHSYLKFNVQGLAGYAVTRATLSLYTNTTSSTMGIQALAVADNSWAENTITYSNAPTLGSVIGSSLSYTAGSWVTVDVTPYVTGEGTYSFGITTVNSSTQSFAAKESGANAAQLIVDLSVPDDQPPSTPSGLNASPSSATQVDLNWTASTDNVSVAGYDVYRDGSLLATLSGSTLSYSDPGAQPNTTYSYTVDAFDPVGNYSNQSSPASVTTPDLPTTFSITTEADTYDNSDFPANNYGSATALRVDSTPAENGFLKFTVPDLGTHSISQASLLVYSNSGSNNSINVYSVADNTWDENALTYSNEPSMGSQLGSSNGVPNGDWVTIDVTSFVTGAGTYSFGITTPGSTTLSFATKESGTNAAQLVINLAVVDTQPPSTPGGLTASASSATQVDLSWNASNDNVGVVGYTIYRDGNAIDSVSGSTLAYSDASVQPNSTYSYTVDAFDQAGNHSNQSSAASVTTPVIATSLTFNVEADTYVNASHPTSNYGSTTVFRVDGSPITNGYLRFTVSGLAGHSITQAKLMIFANSSSAIGIDVSSVADNTWGENSVTYNTAPAMGSVLGSSGSFSSGSWITIDFTAYVTAEGTFSFGISTTGPSTISFAAKESGSNAAQLVVDLGP